MFHRNFLFGTNSGIANGTGVLARDIYQPGKGYGFVVGEKDGNTELGGVITRGFENFYRKLVYSMV